MKISNVDVKIVELRKMEIYFILHVVKSLNVE